jgi:hypothetical protein
VPRYGQEKSEPAGLQARRAEECFGTPPIGEVRRAPAGRRPEPPDVVRQLAAGAGVGAGAALCRDPGARISFHQVHEPSGKRIRYEKAVPGIGPVDTDEIVKGFDLGRGAYVLIDPDELGDLKLEAKKTLDLVQFVEQCEIDPIWFDRPYYVVADDDPAEEAYRATPVGSSRCSWHK